MQQQFKQLDFILRGLIKDLGIENKLLEHQAIDCWSEAVGEKIAQNTKADRVRDGILFVKAKSDVWRNELVFHKPDLIKKLNKKLDRHVIHDIVLI